MASMIGDKHSKCENITNKKAQAFTFKMQTNRSNQKQRTTSIIKQGNNDTYMGIKSD